MTDNTPRPEPMSRESVLAVLGADGYTYPDKHDLKMRARAAVAALYERCEALERAVERKNAALTFAHDRTRWRTTQVYYRNAINYTGTEPSDAEGGG